MVDVTAEWSLLLSWGPREEPAADLTRRIARTVSAVHTATPRARFWLDLDDMMTVWFDLDAGPEEAVIAAGRLVDYAAGHSSGSGVEVSLISQVHEMEDINERQPLSALDVAVGGTEATAVNTLEWTPRDLIDSVLAVPLTAETLLRELVAAWNPDSAVWLRSDLDRVGRLDGANGPVAGWITYLAGTNVPGRAGLVRGAAQLATALPFHRGILIAADRPAGRFDLDAAGTLARLISAGAQ